LITNIKNSLEQKARMIISTNTFLSLLFLPQKEDISEESPQMMATPRVSFLPQHLLRRDLFRDIKL
jgi:hypothetical protein